ncbi:hypothetical protein VNI00_009035 [Paramarasmius palmivorus]|uniref:Alpha/beta hydrolase fold-3 domain-containing protein n=1 Tax=Paramarasmius palmivorus TaxID=297713 RepID=A0AAW0CSY8_9AGAR
MPSPPKLGLGETISLNIVMLQIPFVLLYTVLVAQWSKPNAGSPLNRILYDRTARFVLDHLSIRQLQVVSGTSEDAYSKWAKHTHLEPVIDDLGNDASLLWIETRGAERVLIYLHGGGFAGPLSDFQIEFWRRVQQSLRKNFDGLKLDVAVLRYSINPQVFPTQLQQVILAVRHVMSLGVPRSKIYFAGDSAGGNMIIQLMSHILHPSASLSPPFSETGFAGACLVSPWVLNEGDSGFYRDNDPYDLSPSRCLSMWRDVYLAGIPESQRIFVQPNNAPQDWFVGAEDIFRRILITVGTREVLRDSINQFAETLAKSHGRVDVDVMENGVHCDPIFDVGAKSKVVHPVEKRIVAWFAECITGEGKPSS